MNGGELCSALCLYPNPHFRGRHHRFPRTWSSTLRLLKLVNFLSCWYSLDSRDFTSLWLLWFVLVENSVESSLSFSLFISLTLKGEINKVNVKQTISISVYHSVSVSHPNQSTNCHKPYHIPCYHWINSFVQIVWRQIARERARDG